MKKLFDTVLVFMFVFGVTQMGVAGEHGGHEHGGHEHGGSAVAKQAAKEPSKDDIRNTMKSYVENQSAKADGVFKVEDPDTGTTLNLTMERIHERVGKTGDYYYSCADFKDENGKMWDLDIDVQNKYGKLSVADVRVHKEDNVPSYTYDDNDNRYPLVEGTKRHLGSKGSMMNEHKGSMMNEHKGSMKAVSHEHGGN